MKYLTTSKPLFPPVKKIRPILQDWVLYLPQIVQSDLLKSLRGCDNPPNPDYSKFLVKEIRKDIMRDKTYSSAYFLHKEGTFKDNLKTFTENLDRYNLHFLNHLTESIKILAYCHPEQKKRNKWAWIQVRIHAYLRVNPETPREMKKRYSLQKMSKQEKEKYYSKAKKLKINPCS